MMIATAPVTKRPWASYVQTCWQIHAAEIRDAVVVLPRHGQGQLGHPRVGAEKLEDLLELGLGDVLVAHALLAAPLALHPLRRPTCLLRHYPSLW